MFLLFAFSNVLSSRQELRFLVIKEWYFDKNWPEFSICSAFCEFLLPLQSALINLAKVIIMLILIVLFCIFRSICRISEGLVCTPPATPATLNHTCHICRPSGGPHEPAPHPPPLPVLLQTRAVYASWGRVPPHARGAVRGESWLLQWRLWKTTSYFHRPLNSGCGSSHRTQFWPVRNAGHLLRGIWAICVYLTKRTWDSSDPQFSLSLLAFRCCWVRRLCFLLLLCR